MVQSLDDYVGESKALATPESQAGRAVFEHAYTMAMQVIALRQKRGLTQKQLAGLSGVAQSEISRIERGSIRPTEPTLVKLADAMGFRFHGEPVKGEVGPRRRLSFIAVGRSGHSDTSERHREIITAVEAERDRAIGTPAS